MSFRHGLNREYTDTDNTVAEQYVYVVGEAGSKGHVVQWRGREHHLSFGDRVMVKNGKVALVVPSGIYGSPDVIKTTHRTSGSIMP